MRAGIAVALVLGIVTSSTPATAQSAESVGTRAQGMAGAFVGVTDDASAVYWNPAGLAKGAYFSLVIDGNRTRAVPDEGLTGSERSGWLLALSTPALGISYYRLQTSTVSRPPDVSRSAFELNTLNTDHLGATLVQSLTDFLTVGTTLKVVRGVAGSALVQGDDRNEILDHTELIGHSSTKVDLDVGIMASGGVGRVGLVVRNLSEPEFETESGTDLSLHRQVRAGASVLLLQTWKLAADVDFTRQPGPFGDIREVAVGSEGQVTRWLAARAGIRFNAAGDGGQSPAFSVGGSFAAWGSVLVDGQLTTGSDKAFKGWGIAGRVVF
jgi:hypothetical protein